MIEILVVVGIIALLVGLMLPAVHTVQKMAKETKQKAQFAAIELGLAAFRNDYGDYPPSDPYSWLGDTERGENTSGAQKLAEALLGWDLLGFHPKSGWRVDGTNRWAYPVGAALQPPGSYVLYDRTSNVEMQKRKGRYIDIDTANVFRLGVNYAPGRADIAPHDGLFNLSPFGLYAQAADSFVLCDVFGKGKDIILADGKRVKPGQPILYYRANASGKIVTDVYSYKDNDSLVIIKNAVDVATRGVSNARPLWNPLAGVANAFYTFIADPKASTPNFSVPCRPDSYILISAGADGFYGTDDDIRNFGQ
jgi:type II secretory pathway pseudopilin PulG